MPAKVVNIAEAVKDFLNTQGFMAPTTAERANQLHVDLEAGKLRRVVVVPIACTTLRDTRESIFKTVTIAVNVFQQMVGQDEKTVQDSLIELSEQIIDAVNGITMATFDHLGFAESFTSAVVMDPDSNLTGRVFHAIIELEYVGE